jgi:signal transduction histidine kinase
MNEAIMDGVVTDRATVRQYVENTSREVQHLSRLIDDLFELTTLDTGRVELNREATNLPDMISDLIATIKPQADSRQIKLSGNVSSGVKDVCIAPDKIQRVLLNLLDNAIRHTPQGQQIRVEARDDGTQIRVSVNNTGSIIKSEELPRIFESFYRGDQSRQRGGDGYRGTGLGLAIARGFIQAHGGQIWVESTPESGTTFSFTLPTV